MSDARGTDMRTLVISPHMDDESISCGGLIQVRGAGRAVFIVTVFGRKYDYKEASTEDLHQEELDMWQALRVLESPVVYALGRLPEGEPAKVGEYRVLSLVESALRVLSPDEVIIPSAQDLNQDHRFLNHVCQIALRPVNLGRVFRVLEFFSLDGQPKVPSYYVPLTEAQVQAKLAAVAAYRRESRVTGPRAPENMIAQMRVWGSQCGAEYAEAYGLRFHREGTCGSRYQEAAVSSAPASPSTSPGPSPEPSRS